MDQDESLFLRDFFRAVADRALEPNDDFYVPIYEDKNVVDRDPMELLARGIEWQPGESVQLLSGFRGTGKSTELRRLARRLQRAGYLVALCDIEEYVNLSTPIDVSDFLMAVMGAFGEAVGQRELLGKDQAREGYWERSIGFLKSTKISIEDLKLKLDLPGAAGEIKASLKSDPTFRRKLQETLAGHLGALVEDVRQYVREVVGKLKGKHGDATEVVLLVDSLEHLRGTLTNAEEVHRSAETLFGGHAEKLHLPSLHVVYTVPPFLKVRYPNLGALYAPGGLRLLPAVKLRNRGTGDPREEILEILARVVEARGDWRKLLGRRELLNQLIRHSGGHLSDLLRLVGEVIRRAESLPVDASTVDAAIAQIRNEFLPIANEDAVWLQQVAKSHATELQAAERLPHLARFFDTHMILCYHNGGEWYDVHPLIADTVEEQAYRQAERRRTAGDDAK